MPGLFRNDTTAPWLATRVIAAAIAVPTSTMARTKAAPTLEQQVIGADDDYVKAELSDDEARIRHRIDDRFVFNNADGTVMGEEAFVQYVVKLPMVGQTIRERSTVVEGDVGIVLATTDLRFATSGDPEKRTSLR